MTAAPTTARSRTLGDLRWVLGWIALLWVVELVDQILFVASGGTRSLDGLGVVPREPWGLVGVVFAPFLHASWSHLASNSVSLLLTGMISCRYGRRLTMIAACYAALYGGLLTWLIGGLGHDGADGPHRTVHIGASGVIFGLIGFVLVSAIARKGCAPLLLGLLMLFLYGGAILGGIVPQDRPISWQMHLGGLIGGATAGWQLRNRKAA